MKLFGLIGYPLGHSFSKKYFTEKFEKEGLEDCFFELFPIEHIESFPSILAKQPHLKGLAVTIPHKQGVMPYLTGMSEEAEKIGAVNCIKISGSSLTGYNTDAMGFEQSFIPLLKPHHAKAVVLGTGGASKAIQYILKKISIPFLLVTRDPQARDGYIGYADIDENLLKDYTIIINCSPVGMIPNEQEYPAIPYHLLNSSHYLYDLIYKPEETLFLKKGKEKGTIVKNGFEMLLLQAEANWKIWNE